ncbi:uncharacterized protein LOC106173658 [Lingula anatina]|uniref:Uncharacterized protein LOC106173658 n=1 Tax=Lingula anatina TaxID=7574 RepID=A0A1S3JK73_LINAN|nr:uncharacterized protein LOC106173658 [Lingula anatina]|eukprot:XP_013410309.1 uncharacterized protein LOC106173658 [Lingula anatina]
MSSGFRRVLTVLRSPRSLVILPMSSLIFMHSRQVGRCKGRALITYTNKKQEELNLAPYVKESPKAVLCINCQERLKGHLLVENRQSLKDGSREMLDKVRSDLGSLLDKGRGLDAGGLEVLLACLVRMKKQGGDISSATWALSGSSPINGLSQSSLLDARHIGTAWGKKKNGIQQSLDGKTSKYLSQNLKTFGIKHGAVPADPGGCSLSLSGKRNGCVVHTLLNSVQLDVHQLGLNTPLRCDGKEDSTSPEEDPDKTPADVLFKAQEYINEKMPTIFSQEIQWDFFRDDMVFVNAYDEPHTSTCGVYAFKKWLRAKKFKVKVLLHTRIELLSSVVDPDSGSITVRWRLAGVPFWRSWTSRKRKEDLENWYDGVAIFYVDKNGYIWRLRIDKRETMRRSTNVFKFALARLRPKPAFSPT